MTSSDWEPEPGPLDPARPETESAPLSEGGSSEGGSSEGGALPAEGLAEQKPAAQVLVSGHLNPGMLFLRMLDGMRQAVVPAILSVATQQLWLGGVAVLVFVLSMVYALVRYLTFQYALTEEELITTEGILHRQERRIPINRIQDLNFESTLIRRFVGLVVVSVETASGQGAEAQLDSLSRYKAEVLREALYQVRSRLGHTTRPDQVEETLLHRAAATELTLLGLTNNRLGAILLGIVGLYELANELGIGEEVVGVGGGVVERLVDLQPSLLAVFGIALMFLFLLAGWILSIGASFVMFHGFTLSMREDVLQRRFGLITTRAQTLPRRKVQRVLIEQTLFRRLFGVGIVRADSAGSGMDEKEEARGGRDIIAPLCRLQVAEALVPWLLPGFDPAVVPWQRVSPRVIWRIFFKGLLLALVLGALLAPGIGIWALVVLAILPVSFAVGGLSYYNLAYAQSDGHFAFRWGILGRYRAFVPLQKVQGVVLRAGPVERALGLASLTVYVAGGSPTVQANLPRDEAEHLAVVLGRYAAGSRFVW